MGVETENYEIAAKGLKILISWYVFPVGRIIGKW